MKIERLEKSINNCMKTVVCLFLVSCVSNIYAQKQTISLLNVENNKVKTIKNNRTIEIIKKDRHIVKGTFKIINDSNLLLNNDTIAINEISSISIKPTASKIIGGSLLLVGSSAILLGVGGAVDVYTTSGHGFDGDAGMSLLFLVPLTGIGIITDAIGLSVYSHKKEFLRKKWNIKFEK